MSLILNAVILLGIGSINLVWGKSSKQMKIKGQIIYGLFFSATVMYLINSGLQGTNGLLYDARISLLTVVTLLYQPVTILLTTIAALLFRLYLGGAGTFIGVFTILLTVGVTLLWRKYIQEKLEKVNKYFSYWLLGVFTHSLGFISLITVPGIEESNNILYISILPIGVLVYPFVVLILSQLTNANNDRLEEVEKSARNEKELGLLFTNVPVGIIHFDKSGVIQTCNATFSNIIGTPVNQLIGLNMISLPNKDLVNALKESLKGTKGSFKGYYDTFTSDKELYVNALFSPLNDTKGNLLGGMVVVQDLTEQYKKDQRIQRLLDTCQITGLHNRKIFEQHIASNHHKDMHPLSVTLFSINNFQFIVDTMGYDASEILLQDISDIMIKYIPKEYIYRVTDRDFAIVCPDSIENKDEKIGNVVKEVRNLPGYSTAISFSTASVQKESVDVNWKEINHAARELMYSVKLYADESITKKTIELLMASLFEKSPREKIHSERVSKLVVQFADFINLDNQTKDLLEVSAVLHDIGKLNIDEAFLEKNSSLTDYEYNKIKQHPETGYRILSSVVEYREISKIILSHHERWDGLGYPQKLKGKDIPYEARIIAICDTYDAMTNDRPYRKGLNPEEAVMEIKKFKGIQFDPELADKFIKYLNQNIL